MLAALWLYVKSGAWRAPDARGEWPLSNSKHFPSPVELREIYLVHVICMHGPMTKLKSIMYMIIYLAFSLFSL